MKLKNVKEGQRVQVKDLNEPNLVEYGHTSHTLHQEAVLECTSYGLDDDGHVRLVTTDGEGYYYYTTPENLRKAKE